MNPNEPPPPYWPSVATDTDSSAKSVPSCSASPIASDSKPDKGDGTFSLPKRPRAPSGSTMMIPSAFKVGSKPLDPFELVTIPEICAHLSLLGAFAKLKSQIKLQTGPDVQTSPNELWATYLARAVDRFAAWVKNGLSGQPGLARTHRG
ncbi:hypothetical protein RhiJN_21186 [Ceratobasidium sp. AG-Ba]|nr:hypothetical protein RhiJN_21186 [Ceratobasidium sp. AG-Ba]